jgi:hypothetical protein
VINCREQGFNWSNAMQEGAINIAFTDHFELIFMA